MRPKLVGVKFLSLIMTHWLLQILDRYRDAFEARALRNESRGEVLPTNVILVGHSMGGFVARAAVVHPGLRKGAVETVLTLSSPHRLVSLGTFVTNFCMSLKAVHELNFLHVCLLLSLMSDRHHWPCNHHLDISSLV